MAQDGHLVSIPDEPASALTRMQVRAALDPTGSVVLLDFDRRPTNRAGMGSTLGDCSAVFDDATVARMRGGGEAEPQCVWLNTTRVRAQLGRSTQVIPCDLPRSPVNSHDLPRHPAALCDLSRLHDLRLISLISPRTTQLLPLDVLTVRSGAIHPAAVGGIVQSGCTFAGGDDLCAEGSVVVAPPEQPQVPSAALSGPP